MKNQITLKNITKQYKNGGSEISAVDDISLQFEEGESVAILGASGSGKSTLIQIIGGLTYPTSGTVEINNQKINSLPDDELSEFRNKTVGFVFQSFNLQNYLSAQDNVTIPLLISGEDQSTSDKKAQDMLKKIGLFNRKSHKPSQMSGGEMQRVAIARSLVTQPKIIIADEPTGNLDKESTKNVMTLFQEMTSWGITLITVTHDPRIAKQFSRTIEMEHGGIKSDTKSVAK